VQTFLLYACCFTRKLNTTNESWLENTEGVTSCRCVCLLHDAQLPSRGLAVSLASLSQTCCFNKMHTRATSAFCASEGVHSCCVRKDRRLQAQLSFTRVSDLAHIAGPTDTYEAPLYMTATENNVLQYDAIRTQGFDQELAKGL